MANSLAEGPKGPWLADEAKHPNTMLLPTIQHRSRVALKSKSWFRHGISSDTYDRYSQTAALIPFDYGRKLDKGVAAQDPFYALRELFRLFAAAENQVLNLLDRYTARETSHEAPIDEEPTLTNLVYCQGLLETHIRRLKDLIHTVHHRGGEQWPAVPRLANDPTDKAKITNSALETDFAHMLRHAEAMAERCTNGMNVIMNNTMLAESRRAMSQAKRVTRLTLIAFVYIPLSFTTSFFGMNVTAFATGTMVPLWVWVVTTVPVLLVTVVVFFVDVRAAVARAREMLRQASDRNKDGKDKEPEMQI
jgi:hypothetical protein